MDLSRLLQIPGWNNFIRQAFEWGDKQDVVSEKGCWVDGERQNTALFSFTRALKTRAAREKMTIQEVLEQVEDAFSPPNGEAPDGWDMDDIRETVFATYSRVKAFGHPLDEADRETIHVKIPSSIPTVTPGQRKFVRLVLALFRVIGFNTVALPQKAIAERIGIRRQPTISSYIQMAVDDGWLIRKDKADAKRKAATYHLEASLFDELRNGERTVSSVRSIGPSEQEVRRRQDQEEDQKRRQQEDWDE